MVSKEVNVKSFTFNNETFFAEYHLNYPLLGQLRRVKNSFVDSRGQSVKLFLDELSDIQIDYSGSLTIFSDTKTSKVIGEYCYGQDSSIINYPSAVEEFRSTITQNLHFKNAVTCLPGGGYNLHHFLFEILPALLTFKEEIQNYEALILGSTPGSTFLAEFNEILDLTKNLILVPINTTLKIDISANITAIPFRIYPIDKINEIKSLVLEKCASGQSHSSKVVFIGRQDNDRNRRALVNEAEVLEHLRLSYGQIEIARPGITEISKTVRAISGAKILIGPTGGNLAHLIWATSLELFIEIVPFGYPGQTETQELSQLLGFQYFRVNSDSVQDGNWVYSDQKCRLNELSSLPLATLNSLKYSN